MDIMTLLSFLFLINGYIEYIQSKSHRTSWCKHPIAETFHPICIGTSTLHAIFFSMVFLEYDYCATEAPEMGRFPIFLVYLWW